MAVFNKFSVFLDGLTGGGMDLLGTGAACDDIFVMLMVPGAPTSPLITDTVLACNTDPATLTGSGVSEIAAGNGYVHLGTDAVVTGARVTTTYTLTGTNMTWTSSGAGMASFRYVVVYNATFSAAATRTPIGWWDYASTLTLAAGETFTVKFDNQAVTGAILTII